MNLRLRRNAVVLRQRFANFIGGYSAGPAGHDDFWYADSGNASMSFAGVEVSPDRAMRLAAVQACVRLIANATAMLPLIIYIRTSENSTAVAREHPLYDLLRHQPNPNMTAFEWRQCMTANLVLRGNAYSEIRAGRLGRVDSLWPLHPDHVRVKRLKGTDSLIYEYRPPGYPERNKNFLEDEILHLRDLSANGITGASRIQQARDGIGSALATDIYAATYWGSGSAPGGVLSTDGPLSKDQAKNNQQQWEEAHRGAANSNRVAVLGGGMKYTATNPNNEEAQWLETRNYQVSDIARLFGVPPHMIGHVTPSTSFGTGLEQMSQAFVTYTLGSWLTIWESSIRKDLIDAKRLYFAEHKTAALVKSDIKTRTAAYRVALGRAGEEGWMTPQEVRRLENMNPEPELGVLRTADDAAANAAAGTNGKNDSNSLEEPAATSDGLEAQG